MIVYNDELKVLVEADLRTIIQELPAKFDASNPIVLDPLRQLRKSNTVDKWMPHQLSENKQIVIIKFFSK